MAGSSRDVELVIRARDEAGKAISAISDALKSLTGAQDAAGESAQRAGGLLGQLGATFSGLQKEVVALQGLGSVAKQIDRATEAVTRLEKTAQGAGEAAATLNAKYEAAAQASAQLAERLGAARSALDAQRSSTEQAQAEQAKLNRQVEVASNAYRQTYDQIRRTKEPSDALKQSLRDQRDALVALLVQQEKGDGALAQQRTLLTEANHAFTALSAEAKAHGAVQEKLQRDVQTANEAFDRTQAALGKARDELAQITAAGQGASAALGGVTLTQQGVSEAAKATAESLDKVKQAMDRQKAAGGMAGGPAEGTAAAATAAYRAQVAAVHAARAAWQQAQVEASRLGQEMGKAAAPTRELQTAFVLAKAAAAEAKQEYLSQAAAMNALKGVTQGSFQTFNSVAIALENEARATRAGTLSLRDLLAALFRIPGAAGEAAGGMQRFGEAARETHSFVQGLGGEVRSVVASFAGLYAAASQIEGVVRSYAGLESSRARLSVVFEGNQKAAAEEVQWLMGQAERLGIPFSNLATEYTKVAVAAKEMGFSTENARKIFIAVSEAGRVAGLSADEMQGVFLGLRESIDRGTVNARNFNIEMGAHIPGAMQAMADATGHTVQKFTELQRASGGIAANENTLVRFADNLQKMFGPSLNESLGTLNAGLGRFTTTIQEAQIAVGQGGFGSALNKSLTELGEAFKSEAGQRFFRELGSALGQLVSVVPVLVRHFDALVKVAEAFVSVKVAGFVLGLVTGTGRLSASLKLAAADVARLEAAFAGLNMERMATVWASFRAQVAEAAAAIATLRVETAAAAVGTGALSVAMTTLRGLMIGLTAAARTMWTAIGGVPGLVITALTFIVTDLLGKWVSGVGQATTALEVHGQMLDKIREGYDRIANQGVDGLKKKLADVSTVQIQINSDQLRRDLAKVRDELEAPAFTLRKEVEQFKQGQISGDQFKAAVNAAGEANPHLRQNPMYRGFLEAADKARELEKSIAENDASLRVLRGSATDADRALLGLAETGKQVSNALTPKLIDQFTEALEKLGKVAPDVEAKLKVTQDKESAETALKDALATLKLSDDQINQVLKGANKIPGLTDQQMKLVQNAYGLYRRVLAEIDARAQHDQDKALPLDNTNIRQRIEYIEGHANGRVDPTARNPRSTAYGIGQFTEATWLKLFDQVFPELIDMTKAAKLAMRSQQAAADKMLDELIRQNQGRLARAGIPVTAGNTYLAHLLGADGAIRMIDANPSRSAASIDPTAARKNRGVFYRDGRPISAGELRDWADQRMGGLSRLGTPTPITASGATEQEKFDASVQDFIKALNEDAKAIAESARDAFVNSKVQEQKQAAARAGTTLSPEQEAGIKKAAGDDYDAKAAQAAQQRIEALREEISARLKNGEAMTREEYIRSEATRESIDLSTQEGQAYAELRGRLYDLTEQQKAYETLVGLSDQRKTLAAELQQAFKEGDIAKVRELQQVIADLTAKLKELAPLARAYAEAMGDQKALAAVEKVSLGLQTVKTNLTDAKQINQMLAQGFTQAFSKSMDALGKFLTGAGKLKDVFIGIRDAFLQFAADFLKKIAEMIMQQIILNLLAKMGLGKWISDGINSLANAGAQNAQQTTQQNAMAVTQGAAVAGANAYAATAAIPYVGPELAPGVAAASEAAVLATFLPQVMIAGALGAVMHTGGIVGQAGGANRTIDPAAFAGALRMHTGGIAGLAADEYPTILQRNEEVLTADNPRHIFNQGGDGNSSAAPAAPNVKIVNAFDHGQVLSEALNTDVGQRAIINYVRANRRTINAVLKTG